MRGNEQASRFLTTQSIAAECVCKQRKGLICRKIYSKQLKEFQVKTNCFDRPRRLNYQDRLVLFNMHMYDEFHVPDLLIVLLRTLKGTDSIKSNLINY